MMNIELAVKQMRIARKAGKISAEVQQKLMRRIAPRQSQLNWEKMMAFRAQIEREVAPVLEVKRKAEFDELGVKYVPMMEKIQGFIPAALRRKQANDQAWWDAAELREREAKKAITAKIKDLSKVLKKAIKACDVRLECNLRNQIAELAAERAEMCDVE